jgi:hypothetical protein
MSIEHEVRRLAFKAESLRSQTQRDFELDLKLRAIADACIEAANLLALRERNGTRL